MSISDLAGLTPTPPRTPLEANSQAHGTVTRAPTALTDVMLVTTSGSTEVWPQEVRHGRWWPHPDGTLPANGDPCLVMFDRTTGEPWVLVGPP